MDELTEVVCSLKYFCGWWRIYDRWVRLRSNTHVDVGHWDIREVQWTLSAEKY